MDTTLIKLTDPQISYFMQNPHMFKCYFIQALDFIAKDDLVDLPRRLIHVSQETVVRISVCTLHLFRAVPS